MMPVYLPGAEAFIFRSQKQLKSGEQETT